MWKYDLNNWKWLSVNDLVDSTQDSRTQWNKMMDEDDIGIQK